MVLDKTGTVTTGRMTLVGVTPAAGHHRDELLRLAGAVEAASEDPIARRSPRRPRSRRVLAEPTGRYWQHRSQPAWT